MSLSCGSVSKIAISGFRLLVSIETLIIWQMVDPRQGMTENNAHGLDQKAHGLTDVVGPISFSHPISKFPGAVPENE